MAKLLCVDLLVGPRSLTLVWLPALQTSKDANDEDVPLHMTSP